MTYSHKCIRLEERIGRIIPFSKSHVNSSLGFSTQSRVICESAEFADKGVRKIVSREFFRDAFQKVAWDDVRAPGFLKIGLGEVLAVPDHKAGLFGAGDFWGFVGGVAADHVLVVFFVEDPAGEFFVEGKSDVSSRGGIFCRRDFSNSSGEKRNIAPNLKGVTANSIQDDR